MKKLLLIVMLLGFGNTRAQEIKPGTPEYYANSFEDLFYHGFILGFGEGEYDIESYLNSATQHVQITPAEMLHQTFLNALPQIDPMGLYKRVNSAEEYWDLTVGELRQFSIGFLEGGYMAAMRAAGMEHLLTPPKTAQIHTLCEYLYANMIAGAIKDAQKK